VDVVTRNNVKIVGAGDGPTIMLAHGFGCDQNLWRLVAERLAPSFRPELGDELTDSFCRADPSRALVFARATFLSDNRADLARVAVPTLVIECAHDTLAPREIGAYVHQHIEGSELVTLDATGHCPHLSAPDPTAQAIADFARQT
jgi:pimeloyl-ACP methyl ester carboxylesterase